MALLARLVAAWGPSGREEAVADLIATLLQPHVDTLRRDALGNVLAMRHPRPAGGSGRRLLLTASIDSGGGLVTDIGADGRLRFGLVGPGPAAALVGRTVRFAGGATGVVAAERVDQGLKASDCWVDLGVASAEAARRLTGDGEMFVLDGTLTELGDLWHGPRLAARAGCAALLAAVSRLQDSPHELHLAFTVQGQVTPPRGAHTAAFAVGADQAVAITATAAVPDQGAVAKLGAGPVLRLREQHWVLRPTARAWLTAGAGDAGVAWQGEALATGASEAGTVAAAGGGIPVGVLAVPVRYAAGAYNLVHPQDLEGAARWLAALMSRPLP